MTRKTLLLVIDMQNDFCLPEGALYVPGAETDVRRLTDFIRINRQWIGTIWLTQDNHQVMDIAHPGFWEDREGNQPAPFTTITSAEVKCGRWKPRLAAKEVTDYLEKVEENEGYRHTVWPEHCIWGSEGAAIEPMLMNSVKEWARQGKYFQVLSKGMYPLTEHFGIFQANIPREDVPETAWNHALMEEMNDYDMIWLAGEAQSHCVAYSVKQLFPFPHILEKLVILEDCMSPVRGYEQHALPIFEAAVKKGARLITSTAYQSNNYYKQ